jgi:hypothetical protein
MLQQVKIAQKRHDEKMNLLHAIFFGSPHSSSSSSSLSSLNKNFLQPTFNDLFEGGFANYHEVLNENGDEDEN